MTAIKPLVVLDCDSTTVAEEVIELIADAAGTREEVARITTLAMEGRYDFPESLNARVATLAGVSDSVFQRVASAITLNPGFAELVDAVKARDGKIGVVSGGFMEVLDLFLPGTGVDVWHANTLEIEGNSLTGRVVGEIVDAAAKAKYLRAWGEQFGIPPEHTIAIGDGANDLEMMRAARFAVGFRPKPIVREAADLVAEHSLAEAISLLDKL